MHRIDGAGATGTGQWTEGDPSTGTPATEITADWLNAIQNEIENVIVTGAGIPLNKASNSQLLLAVQTLIGLLGGSFVPQSKSGASYSFVAADRGLVTKRTHTSSMTDTLPGTSPGVLAAGWSAIIVNDSAQTYSVAPGTGAQLNGGTSAVSIAARTTKRVFSDGSNYFTIG